LADMEYGLRLESFMCSCVFGFSANLLVTWATGFLLFLTIFLWTEGGSQTESRTTR